MGARGIFLRALAFGALALVMATVPPPPEQPVRSPRIMDPNDPRCDIPEVTVTEGVPELIGTSNEEKSSTLYLHSSQIYSGLRFDIKTDLGTAIMWVPYFSTCFENGTDGWFHTYSFCEMEPEMDVVKCDFAVHICKYTCTQDLRSTGPLSFTQTAFGYSRWRQTEPHQGCTVYKLLHNAKIIFDQCFPYPYGPATTPTPPTPLTTATPYKNYSEPEVQVVVVVNVN